MFLIVSLYVSLSTTLKGTEQFLQNAIPATLNRVQALEGHCVLAASRMAQALPASLKVNLSASQKLEAIDTFQKFSGMASGILAGISLGNKIGLSRTTQALLGATFGIAGYTSAAALGWRFRQIAQGLNACNGNIIQAHTAARGDVEVLHNNVAALGTENHEQYANLHQELQDLKVTVARMSNQTYEPRAPLGRTATLRALNPFTQMQNGMFGGNTGVVHFGAGIGVTLTGLMLLRFARS